MLGRALCEKLAAVEVVGIVEQYIELRDQHVLAKSIDGLLVFQLKAVQQAIEQVFLFGRNAQRLVNLEEV